MRPVTPLDGVFGLLYGSRVMLVIAGLVIFASGAFLFYAKFKKKRRLTGPGLMAVYLCFLYTATLNLITHQYFLYWLTDLIACTVAAALWIYWKLQTEYINPKHFRSDIVDIIAEDRN